MLHVGISFETVLHPLNWQKQYISDSNLILLLQRKIFVIHHNWNSARIKHLSVHDEHQFTDQRIWSLAECGEQIGCRITTKWKIWDIKQFKVSNDSPNRIIIYELEPSESLKCQKTTLSAKMSYRVTKTGLDEFKRKVESGKMKLLNFIFLKFSKGKNILVWWLGPNCGRRLHWCWWRTFETKCVDGKFEMLLTDSGSPT